MAAIPAHVLVVVARQGRAGEGHGAIDGHANVDTTLNVYTQVLDGCVRDAVERVAGELFTIVHKREGSEGAAER